MTPTPGTRPGSTNLAPAPPVNGKHTFFLTKHKYIFAFMAYQNFLKGRIFLKEIQKNLDFHRKTLSYGF